MAYFSDRNKDHGSFNLSIDDDDPMQLSSYGPSLVGNQMLFKTSLAEGPHTLTIMNVEPSKVVGVDYFMFVGSSSVTPC